MPIDPAQHSKPARNMDPAQDDRDPGQINADGTPGDDAQLSEDLETAQTGGSRNERVTEFSATRHHIEPSTTASAQPGYATGDTTGDAEGISTHSLKDELAEQAKLKAQPADTAEDPLVYSTDAEEKSLDRPLPGKRADKVETVEISDLTPHR